MREQENTFTNNEKKQKDTFTDNENDIFICPTCKNYMYVIERLPQIGNKYIFCLLNKEIKCSSVIKCSHYKQS